MATGDSPKGAGYACVTGKGGFGSCFSLVARRVNAARSGDALINLSYPKGGWGFCCALPRFIPKCETCVLDHSGTRLSAEPVTRSSVCDHLGKRVGHACSSCFPSENDSRVKLWQGGAAHSSQWLFHSCLLSHRESSS